jgi:membrane protease YdiL (CAAX protease family)
LETTPDILSPLKPVQLPLRILSGLIITTVVVSLLGGTMYRWLSQLLSPIWLGVALFHTFLSLIVVIVWLRQGNLRLYLALAPTAGLLGSVRSPLWFYAPSVLVLVAAVAAASLSAVTGGPVRIEPDWLSQAAFILWIPVIEETVFRGGVSGVIGRYAPGIWGIWFSALIFAWVHSMPTFSQMAGVPLGPFLLGLICEYLRRAGGSLVPAIIFHMICNSTVVIFSLGDARWMSWLRLLYS